MSIRLLLRDLGLAAVGAASLLAYCWLLPSVTYLSSTTYTPVAASLPFTLASFEDPGPVPELIPESAAQLHAAAAVDLAIALTALYLLYVVAMCLGRGRLTVLGVTVVFGVAVAAQALMVVSPYAFSGDVYSYGMYGRIFSVYGQSPYSQTPAQFPGDPFLPYVFWMHVPSFYGPLWTLISGWIAASVGGDVGLAVVLFRLVESASVLGAALLVLLLLRHNDPERALAGTILLAWSPFVIVESGLGAHNDALMAALIVFGLVLAWQRPGIFSTVSVGAVVLAGLVKATALALLPLLGIYLLRRSPSWLARFGVVLVAGLLTVGIGTAIVWPVWAGPATFAVGTLGSGADRYVNSLAEPALGEIRKSLGASTDDLEVPLQFGGWWVGTHTDTVMHETRAPDSTVVQPLPAWTSLLVVGPERDKRLRVYDPLTERIGYADVAFLGPIDAPPEYADDHIVQALIVGPVGSWTLQEANRQIRIVGWGAFALAMLLALIFGTRSPAGLATAWVGVCLVLEYVTLTWFWPWYVLWGLMPAALVPRSRLTRLTVYLGWGVLLAYSLMGFQDGRFWYLHNFRAIPMFGLPLVLFLLDELLRGIWWTGALTWRRLRAPRPISLESRRADRARETVTARLS
ncbi:MAG: hypothetical protein IT306_10640 [Chloroflexi bacterium]|nr:hypothetical protein [Chloroflexota bacterium]